MKKSDFYFDLPQEQIAQIPLKDRTASKLMVVDRATGKVNHKVFTDLLSYLNEGDCLVINDTKVLPARIFGVKKSGAKVEFLLLKRIDNNKWESLVKPGKKAKIGNEFYFGINDNTMNNDNIYDSITKDKVSAKIIDITDDGSRIIEFDYAKLYATFEEFLDDIGEMPLPPYITAKLEDQTRYQTVYGQNLGSAAAPTAGLHFTEDFLCQIQNRGVKIAKVMLHVGLGTFRPVKTDDITDHKMHSEYFEITQAAADLINDTHNAGKKVISVGTTSTRVLESVSDTSGKVFAKKGWTDIFIYPEYNYKCIDGLITNFHLPESTLIMLVSAFCKREWILDAYRQAVEMNYRFFSFGDAMLII